MISEPDAVNSNGGNEAISNIETSSTIVNESVPEDDEHPETPGTGAAADSGVSTGTDLESEWRTRARELLDQLLDRPYSLFFREPVDINAYPVSLYF